MGGALHLYGFVRASEPCVYDVASMGEEAHNVYLSCFEGIGGIVSEAESPAVEGTRRNLMAHSRVLEEIMRNCVVLPVRFGVVVPDEYTLQEKIMRPSMEYINRLLSEMDGRAELSLKAFYHEEAILAEIVTENRPILQLRDRIRGRSPEAAYYDKIRLGEMIAEAMANKARLDADQIITRLQPLAVSHNIGDSSFERIVVNVSFLVEQHRIGEFDDAVDRLNEAMGHRMRFKYLGPLPPYSFVGIHLPAEL